MTGYPDGKLSHVEQNNYGGAFIGHNNYGTINTIDKTTKAILAKLAQDAPALADLLSKALQDGFVSPDVVYALQYAARNINEDVADALRTASRNINEDVAQDLLTVSRNIQQTLSPENRYLEDMTTRIEEALRCFEDSSGTIVQNLGSNIVAALPRMPRSQTAVIWKRLLSWFIIGLFTGMAALAYLSHHFLHHW